MSKLGLALSGVYLAIAVYLIATQGLFGESFIALLLGLPWVLIPAFFEFGGGSQFLAYVFLLSPIALNALVLYGIGHVIGRATSRS